MRLKRKQPGDMSGNNLVMGSGKVTGLAAATVNGDALRYEQLVGTYLPLSGGTMSGQITMGDNNITQINQLVFHDTNSYLDCDTGRIINLRDPVGNQDGATKKYVDDTATSLWTSDASNAWLSTAKHIDVHDKDLNNVYNIRSYSSSADWDYLNFKTAAGDNVFMTLIRYQTTRIISIACDVEMNGNLLKVEGGDINMGSSDLIDVTEIKGTSNQAIYIKPQGTGILYLG